MNNAYNSKLSKALEVLKTLRVFSPNVIAELAKLSRSEVELIIGVLLAQGRIRRIEKGKCICEKCPFSQICSFKSRITGSIVVYEYVGDDAPTS